MQVVTLLDQQWLSINGEFKNPVVVQSPCLEISASLQNSLDLKEIGSNDSQEMVMLMKLRAVRQKRTRYFLPCPLHRLSVEGQPRLRLDFPPPQNI